jgi:hypothetical protein
VTLAHPTPIQWRRLKRQVWVQGLPAQEPPRVAVLVFDSVLVLLGERKWPLYPMGLQPPGRTHGPPALQTPALSHLLVACFFLFLRGRLYRFLDLILWRPVVYFRLDDLHVCPNAVQFLSIDPSSKNNFSPFSPLTWRLCSTHHAHRQLFRRLRTNNNGSITNFSNADEMMEHDQNN